MGDCRAELAALIAAYDNHRKWTINAVFEGLRQAVEHARAVLAQPETASSVEAAIAAGQPVTLPSGTVIADPAWFESLITIRTADPLKRQALRPIPVSERLPGPKDCDAESCCWRWNTIFRLWARQQYDRKWYEFHSHWLPAHALPLPEVE